MERYSGARKPRAEGTKESGAIQNNHIQNQEGGDEGWAAVEVVKGGLGVVEDGAGRRRACGGRRAEAERGGGADLGLAVLLLMRRRHEAPSTFPGRAPRRATVRVRGLRVSGCGLPASAPVCSRRPLGGSARGAKP